MRFTYYYITFAAVRDKSPCSLPSTSPCSQVLGTLVSQSCKLCQLTKSIFYPKANISDRFSAAPSRLSVPPGFPRLNLDQKVPKLFAHADTQHSHTRSHSNKRPHTRARHFEPINIDIELRRRQQHPFLPLQPRCTSSTASQKLQGPKPTAPHASPRHSTLPRLRSEPSANPL